MSTFLAVSMTPFLALVTDPKRNSREMSALIAGSYLFNNYCGVELIMQTPLLVPCGNQLLSVTVYTSSSILLRQPVRQVDVVGMRRGTLAHTALGLSWRPPRFAWASELLRPVPSPTTEIYKGKPLLIPELNNTSASRIKLRRIHSLWD